MVKRWEKEGELYLKVPGDRIVDANGVEDVLFAKVIPPFVQPRQYWLSVKIRSTTAGIPESVMSYRMRGVNVPIARDQQQVETDDVTGDELLARYGTEEATEVYDPDDTPSVDAGLDGDGDWLAEASQTGNFFEHKAVLGLPDKAVFTDANLVMFVDQFTRKGFIKKNKEIDEPGFLAVAMGADDITVSVDWGDIMWGDQLDIETLAGTIMDLMPKFQDASASIGIVNPSVAAKNWLQLGLVEDTHTIGLSLGVWTRMTVKCDVYTHRANRIISVS